MASPAHIARAFWDAVDRADFDAAAALMAPTALIDWPLSNERMPSPRHWKQVNAHYPGRWRAEIQHLVVGEDTVVTTTRVSDGGPSVVAISFFTFEDGRITRLVEYWPETYAAPSWRAPWLTPIDTAGEPNT